MCPTDHPLTRGLQLQVKKSICSHLPEAQAVDLPGPVPGRGGVGGAPGQNGSQPLAGRQCPRSARLASAGAVKRAGLARAAQTLPCRVNHSEADHVCLKPQSSAGPSTWEELAKSWTTATWPPASPAPEP